jgi:FkbM family methyltransferase
VIDASPENPSHRMRFVMNAHHFFEERIAPRLVPCDRSFLPSLQRGVLLYGAGELGSLALDYFEACGTKVLAAIDQKKSGLLQGRKGSVPICSPKDAAREWLCLGLPIAVATATVPFIPVKEFLHASGWTTVLPFYEFTREANSKHPLANGWTLGDVNDTERQRILDLCCAWADETSLFHFEAYVAWHANLTEIPLPNHPISPDERYAVRPLLDFLMGCHRQFVDVGSHLGESVRRLSDVGITFSDYVLIEPDSNSRKASEKKIYEILQSPINITILDRVIGRKSSTVEYVDGLGYCSQIWPHGTSKKLVTALDQLNLSPDFIKIHTEGSEFDVLAGAQQTIDKFRPALAFSIYHTRFGLVSGMAEIIARHEDYQWYFRLHSFQGTGAFVYGLPKIIGDL